MMAKLNIDNQIIFLFTDPSNMNHHASLLVIKLFLIAQYHPVVAPNSTKIYGKLHPMIDCTNNNGH
jgi:hypothetical protein